MPKTSLQIEEVTTVEGYEDSHTSILQLLHNESKEKREPNKLSTIKQKHTIKNGA